MRRASLLLLLLSLGTILGCSASYPTAPDPIAVVAVRLSSFGMVNGAVVVGRSVSLSLSAVDSDRVFHPVGAAEVTWFTSNSAVLRSTATPNSSSFQAIAPGTATLFGSYKGFTDRVDVTVTAAQ